MLKALRILKENRTVRDSVEPNYLNKAIKELELKIEEDRKQEAIEQRSKSLSLIAEEHEELIEEIKTLRESKLCADCKHFYIDKSQLEHKTIMFRCKNGISLDSTGRVAKDFGCVLKEKE